MKIANKDGFRYGENAYLIGNEFGLICVAYGDYEGTALDNAVDAGYMDCQLMSDEDYAEYDANGWHDSFICAGNASEPFWSEYLWIKPASERERGVKSSPNANHWERLRQTYPAIERATQ